MLDRLNFNSIVILRIFFFLFCKLLYVFDEIKKNKRERKKDRFWFYLCLIYIIKLCIYII